MKKIFQKTVTEALGPRSQYTVRVPALVRSSSSWTAKLYQRENILQRYQNLYQSPAPFQLRTITKCVDLEYKGTSLHHMKSFLKRKSVNFTESHPCLKLSLPKNLLGEAVSEELSKLKESFTVVHVNKVTGQFVAPDIAVTGSWIQLECILNEWFEIRKKQKNISVATTSKASTYVNKIKLGLSDDLKTVWDSGQPVDQLGAPEFRKLLAHFRLKNSYLKKEDFKTFQAKCCPDLKVMYFPVRYVTGDIIGLRELKVVDGCLEETYLPNTNQSPEAMFPFFLNLERSWTKAGVRECVMVGSALDLVVLTARLPPDCPVVCLPDWTRLPPELLPFLDQFNLVTIWLGFDITGVEVGRNFSRKIGDKYCRIVTNEHPSALQAVQKKLEVTDILESAAKQHHDFITSFETLRHDVFLEFLKREKMEGVKWERFDNLNQTLKGFRRGEMTVITGRTGSGKTTFMSEYSLDLCNQGVSTLWGSFEVRNVRLVRMMMKQFSLIDLDQDLDAFDRVAEMFTQLPLYFTTFHGTNSVENVLDAMAHAVYVHDIAHVIIDNIQFMIGSGSGNIDKYTRQDQCIELFRKFATLHNVHVTLVIHPRKDQEERLTIQSIFGGGKATQEADNVLLLQTEETEGPMKRKSLEIVKNRYAGDLDSFPLVFSKPFLSFSKKAFDILKKDAGHKKSEVNVDHFKKKGRPKKENNDSPFVVEDFSK